MIQEAYVSFEVAKLLKEKGFNKQCRAAYTNYGKIFTTQIQQYITNVLCSKSNLWECTAPTQQMAMAWLREVYGIHVSAIPCAKQHTIVWLQNILNLNPVREGGMFLQLEPNKKCYNSHEEAVENELKYSLENLI